MNWYLEVLKKYTVFQGRAHRTEYWMFVLFNFIFGMVLGIIDGIIGTGGILYSIYALAVLLPTLAVSVRRLHDIGKSGWWLLIGLVPVIGVVVLLIFALLDSQPGSNTYGPSPKEQAA